MDDAQRPAGAAASPSVTLDSVAGLAGVSRQTVSNVLLHPERVAASTRAKVQDAIRESGYRPSLPARQLATRERIIERPSDRGLSWMLHEGEAMQSHLSGNAATLLGDALEEIARLLAEQPALPRANLHADLFRDNVLFDGPHLAGVIEFYNACSGWMLYDLAITLNDWCSHEDGELDGPRARALLAAYASRRPFTALEAELWPEMLRVACVRFWLSRLIAAEAFAGQDVLIHDPGEFERRLAKRQKVDIHLPFAL